MLQAYIDPDKEKNRIGNFLLHLHSNFIHYIARYLQLPGHIVLFQNVFAYPLPSNQNILLPCHYSDELLFILENSIQASPPFQVFLTFPGRVILYCILLLYLSTLLGLLVSCYILSQKMRNLRQGYLYDQSTVSGIKHVYNKYSLN